MNSFDMYISNADDYTAQIAEHKAIIAKLEASRRANLAMAWTCDEALDDDGALKSMIESPRGNSYIRSVRPSHDLDVILTNKDAVKAIGNLAVKAGEKAVKSFKPKESDLQAIFKLIPRGEELDAESSLEPDIVYSTRGCE